MTNNFQSESREPGQLVCEVCPHYCSLKDGEKGKCLVRQNLGGRIALTKYGQVSLLAVEPIEKRPLYHFCPGERFLSVGFFGCSFSCDFCQNFTVSQVEHGNYKYIDPYALIEKAKEKNTSGVVFTYNEPTVHIEYILEAAKAAREAGLKTVLKTNGFVTQPVAEALVTAVDAVNVDWKGDDEEYRKTCQGTLAPVKMFIKTCLEGGLKTEISYLVLPRMIHDVDFHREAAIWIGQMDCTTPVHLLYFFPFHRMQGQKYEVEELISVHEIFSSYLHYVYISNIHHDAVNHYRNSYCRTCGEVMVDRLHGTKVINKVCCFLSQFEAFEL